MIVNVAPGQSVSEHYAQAAVRRPWAWQPYLLGIAAMLFGVGALPVSISLKAPLAGAALGAMGAVFALSAMLAALILRARGWGIAVLSLLVCGAALFGSLEWAGGAKNLVNVPALKQALKGTPDGIPQSDRGTGTETDTPPGKPDPDIVVPPVTDNPAVASLIKRLKSEDSADRIKAANELARLGDKAKPAGRALCSAAVDNTSDVRQAALEAMEKIHPTLVKPITTLLVDPQNAPGAALQLAGMGEGAAPALPVLIWRVRQPFSWNETGIRALVSVGPTDPESVRTLIGVAQKSAADDGRTFGIPPNQIAAIAALGELTQNKGQLRKEIVAALVKTLTECAASENPAKKSWNDRPTLATIAALADYGPDAKEAIPLLKKMKLDKDMNIREAAAAALEKIDK